MNELIQQDVDYLMQQSQEKIDFVISGMSALLQDTDDKIEAMESQTFFQRMIKTVFGKNKVTKEEIRKNHDKLNEYLTTAISSLYDKSRINDRMLFNLGEQINELYASYNNILTHEFELRVMIGGFVNKLNQKIESIDNFHMLNTEINQGVYSGISPIIAILIILSQYDHRIIEDDRKLGILLRSMADRNILNQEDKPIREYLSDIVDMPMGCLGNVHLILDILHDNYISSIFLKMIYSYHFLPDMKKKLKKPELIIDQICNDEGLDDSIRLSVFDIYDDLLNTRKLLKPNFSLTETNGSDVIKQERLIETNEANVIDQDNITENYNIENLDDSNLSDKEKFEKYKKLAEQGNEIAQFKLGEIYYYGTGVELDFQEAVKEAIKWYKKAAEQGNMDAQYNLYQIYSMGSGIEEDQEEAMKWLEKAANQGHEFAVLEYDTNKKMYELEMAFERDEKIIDFLSEMMDVETIISKYIEEIANGWAFHMVKGNNSEKVREKLHNATFKYALLVPNDEVIALIDLTLRGNGKEGILFYEHGISFNYLFGDMLIQYEEINSMEIKRNKLYFHGSYSSLKYYNSNSTPYISGGLININALKRCIEEIQSVI